jgi:hypothetical protein
MLGLGLGSQPTTESGIFGSYQSLNLDGNSDYVALPESFRSAFLQANTSGSFFSASAWVNIIANDGDTSQIIFKAFTDTSNQFILSYHKYYTEWRASIITDGDSRMAAYDIPGSSNDDGSGYGTGWQHFLTTCTILGGAYSIRLYRNGVLIQNTYGVEGQQDWIGSEIATAHIGASQDGSSAFMDGQIDQVAFWDMALSGSAVTAIYNGGVMRDLTIPHTDYSPANLLAYYQFEGNALDSSGNGYHGTLNGTAGFSTNQP